jgi:hypothetical protein
MGDNVSVQDLKAMFDKPPEDTDPRKKITPKSMTIVGKIQKWEMRVQKSSSALVLPPTDGIEPSSPKLLGPPSPEHSPTCSFSGYVPGPEATRRKSFNTTRSFSRSMTSTPPVGHAVDYKSVSSTPPNSY